MTAPEKGPEKVHGLETREVFLDTEVYKGYGHNLATAPMKTLQKHVEEGRISLHITDINLREVGRQIEEGVASLKRTVDEVNLLLNAWKTRSPEGLPDIIASIEEPTVSDAAFKQFRMELESKFNMSLHKAAEMDARPIFRDYFNRKAPFDGKASKEFPDAFIIAALASWCEKYDSNMYVVTHDKAMQRAASATGRLLPIDDLNALFSLATAAEAPEALAIVEPILEEEVFLELIASTIQKNMGNVGVVYSGELPDGEATEAKVNGTPIISDYSIIHVAAKTISLILKLHVPIIAEIQYSDFSHAMWDNEDECYFGGESGEAEIEDEPLMRVYLLMDRDTGEMREFEILTSDIEVSESYETY
jgi:hypothetical protein